MFCIGCIISVVCECKVRGLTQAAIVTNFLKSIDKKCNELSNVDASNIVRGVKNPSGYLMDALAGITSEDYGELTDYFEHTIVTSIRENDRTLVKNVLIDIIWNDQEIMNDTVVDVVSGTRKTELTQTDTGLAPFFAGVFLFALKNTKNNVGGKVKTEVKKYIEDYKNRLGVQSKTMDYSQVSRHDF